MKKKIGASKSIKKYGSGGGIVNDGPGSKSTSTDVDKLPPMSAPPTGTGYMKKGGIVSKKKMQMGGTNTSKFPRKEPSNNMMKPNTSASLRPAAPNPKPAPPKAKMGGSIKSKKK